MNILHINKAFYLKGGVERYLFAVTKLQEKHGDHVMHFSMKDEKNLPCKYEQFFVENIDVSNPGLKLLNHALRPIWYKQAQEKLEELIAYKKPDIAHIHLLYHHLSPSILPILKKHGIPVVMTVHDYKLVCPNYLLYTEDDTCKRCKGHKYYQSALHKCLKDSVAVSAYAGIEMSIHKLMQVYEKHVDLFIAPSEFVRDTLVEFGQNPKKITVIPHFIDQEFLTHADRIPAKESEQPYMLYFGRLAQEKGVDKILEMMYIYKPGIELKIAGDGPMKEELLHYLQTHELHDKVSFLGHLETNELISTIKGASAVLMPSQFHEPFGFSALETMALGTPLVASSQGALKQLVDPRLGATFPYKDKKAMVQALHQVLRWDRTQVLKDAKTLFASKYLPDQHYQVLSELYTYLIKTKS